jgi:small subunit ribosomal protein S1
MKFDQFFKLECGIQNYAWGEQAQEGKTPFIAELMNLEAEPGKPYAELWIGAHPDMPAKVCDRDRLRSFKDLLNQHPEELLGFSVTREQIADLPFLLKVLSCQKPLSIQAHPDRELAAKLHEQDPEHYPDANHKPEIAIALTEFDAFCRFRHVPHIRQDLERRNALKAFFETSIEDTQPSNAHDWLKDAYARIFTAEADEVELVLRDLAQELDAAESQTTADEWFLKTSKEFPGDAGALSAYFLNAVHLRPGEAIFLDANEPHAYLKGTIVECMANSNNVVRAGLTPKFIDRDVLLNMLTYAGGDPQIIAGEAIGSGDKVYRGTAKEFQVEMWKHDLAEEKTYTSESAISLLLVLSGSAELRTASETLQAPKGSIWLWPGSLPEAKVRFLENGTTVVRARPNFAFSRKEKDVIDLPTGTVDFAAMLEQFSAPAKSAITVGDKVTGTVTAIAGQSLFLDINAKSEGILDCNELLDADGQLKVSVGDTLEAYCLGVGEGEIRLTTKVSGGVSDGALFEAYEAGIPVEGRVLSERKGGYEVMVGSQKGFCPYSQIDIYRQDAGIYIGEKFAFLISEYDEEGRNLVLNRRRVLERERALQRAELKEKLEVGSVVKAVIRKLMPFGAFADLGGMDGLIPIGELAWGMVEKPEDVVSEGQEVDVEIRSVDWDQERISLSLKRAAGNPWDEAGGRFHIGGIYEGTVRKLMPFGAFVELTPGIEGLVHISKLGAGRRINHPREVVAEGALVEVEIESIDFEKQRISLSMEKNVPEEEVEKAAALKSMTGTVEKVVEFGVFVKLSKDQTGLLHISQVELKGSTNPRRALADMFKVGSEVTVVVKEIRGDRISLTLPETLERESDKPDLSSFSNTADQGLGSLGSLFDGLDL